MSWNTSDRRQRLPRNWQTIRAAVKARAHGRCEADRHDPRCNGIGTDADHIIAGDNHAMSNLQWLSRECHKAKTNNETRVRNRENKALRRREQEPHPGRIA